MQSVGAVPRGPSARGLFRRARELKEQSGSAASISEDERAEILAEIAALDTGVQADGKSLAFSAQKGGGLLPLLTNLAAAAAIAVGLAALFWRFGTEEQQIVATARSVVGAEGELVAALREESAAQLAERDREVEASLRRLKELTAERELLKAAGAEGRGDDSARVAALERRIADASAALERAREDRRAAEAAAAPRAAAPAAPPAPQPLADSARLADSERLALERLAASYRGFEREAQGGAWDAAAQRLDEAEALFGEDAASGLPVIQRIRPVEQATISALRSLLVQARDAAGLRAPSRADELLGRVTALIRQAEARFRAGQVGPAETLYLSALSEIPDVRTGYERVLGIQKARWQEEQAVLNRLLADLQAEVARGRQALAAAGEDLAREREARRQEQSARAEKVASFTRALREQGDVLASGRQRPPDGKVFDLLKTKALLMQVVDSGPVRAQYPDLYNATEEYLDRYGTDKAQAGEQAALSRVVALLDRLLGERPANTAGMSLEDTFRALVDRLAALLRAI